MIDYRLEGARDQDPLEVGPYVEWSLPDDRIWAAFHRTGADFILRFFGLADFWVRGDGRRARCFPAPETPAEIQRQLYRNHVLPLMLSRQGKPVFHASAVTVTDGAVAFLADSGRGKSTLAASFAAAGDAFLTDDRLVLERKAEGYQVVPIQPSIGLRDDSLSAIMGPRAEHLERTRYSLKTRLPAQTGVLHCDQARPLKAAYFLGQGQASGISFARVGGVEALEMWERHAFALDLEDRAWLAAHFADVAKLVETVPCYHLDYPRRFEDLARLRHAILEHAAGPGAAK